jgi:Fe2+ transport system protein FeoA
LTCVKALVLRPGQFASSKWQDACGAFPPLRRDKDVNMSAPKLAGSKRRADSRCEVCPLSRVQAGVAVRIKQLCAAPEVQSRLREIGFCEDQIIRLLTSHSNFICQVCSARLAISEQLAGLILVEPVAQKA